MLRPVRILIAGWSCAALLAGSAVISRSYWENQTASAEAECKADDSDTSEWSEFPFVCDRHMLGSDDGRPSGPQRRIVEAHQAANSWQTDAILAALLLVMLSAIPVAWYFLLNRIKELANAFRR